MTKQNKKELPINPDDITFADYVAYKKYRGFKNADIAKIVGLKASSVKTMAQPKKKLPCWIKAMIFEWKLSQNEQ